MYNPPKKNKFLFDENFINWRLLRSEEQEAYWSLFRQNNPILEKDLDEAIRYFDVIQLNNYHLDEKEKKDIYEIVLQKSRKHKRRNFYIRISSSAAILLVLVISILFILDKNGKNILEYLDNESIIGQALPEEEVYIVSGNQVVNIANQTNVELTKDATAIITDSTQSKKKLKLTPETMNKLVVPFGKRSNLTLADGTKICINSGTQVDFPSKFAGKTREIYVNGEIFIDVAEDLQKPFIVNTNEMNIRVYGTSFNVSAYNEDVSKTVVLVKGKVSVKTNTDETKLSPNEKFNLINGEISTETVDVSEYISWTKGVLEFDETPISEILKKVGRYYNVQFENNLDTKLNDKTCSGKLFLSNNLDSVMISVSVLSSTKYHRENTIIHISKK